MPNSYFAFGLDIRSDITLPELVEGPGQGNYDVDIRIGTIPADLPDTRYRDERIQIGRQDTVVTIAGVARYRVRGGCEVTVEPVSGVAEHDIRNYLLGSIWGVVCHERGLLPLHANAVEVNGRAIAFAGHSGAGKSTLAAALEKRGYGVLSDDICVLSLARGEPPRAWPGIPRVRLLRDSAEALGRNMEDMQLATGGLAKYQFPLARPASRDNLPLARIYVLDPPGDAGGIARMPVSTALGAIMMHTYRQQYLDLAGATGPQFARNTQLLAHVPVFRLPWRKDFMAFDANTAALERHMLGITADADTA